VSIRGYSSPKAFGHRLVQDILDGDVIIQEKVDGSQISFGVYDGELCVRSRNQQVDLEDAGMFSLAVDVISQMKDDLPDAEQLLVSTNAGVLGLSYAPVLWQGNGTGVTLNLLKELLNNDSVLGGVTIEGVVIKNYDKYLNDKVMMAKYVSADFQEKHGKDWKQRNPSTNEHIVGLFNKEAIFQKAVQHLKEAGELEGEPKDIGKLMKELNQDIEREHGEEIKETLYQREKRKIFKGIANGFPEWYKEQLAKQAFGEQ
jgi:hypothetical protein